MKKRKKDNYFNQFIKRLLIKTMICILLFLAFLIGIKKIDNFDSLIYNNIYSKSLSFAKLNSWYEKHFGSIFPIKSIDDVKVFSESLTYKSKKGYKDGVVLTVDDNYLVPSICSGIVVFIGEKEDYGKTIIIEDENNIDTWYSNINVLNINMYDYIKKGEYLGEVINNKLIMNFQKNGKKEDYNKFI